MIPLTAAIPGGLSKASLTWSRRGRTRELKLNNEIVGTLEQPSFWCSKHEAVTSAASWTFRQAGFLRNGAEILDSAQQSIAILKAGWGGPATLAFNDGQTFLIKTQGFWHPVWSVTTLDGQATLQLHKRERRVEVTNRAAFAADRLALLILFTLYRMWQAEQDASAAALAAS
jgi:hypothetical protein